MCQWMETLMMLDLCLQGRENFIWFVSLRVVPMGYTDAKPAGSSSPDRYFLEFIQMPQYSPKSNQALLLSLSHCDNHQSQVLLPRGPMSWPHVSIYKREWWVGCFGQIEMEWGRGSWPRLVFQQETHCWPELGNITRWWNPIDVNVQDAIERTYHRDRKQWSYVRKKPRRQGTDDIFWFRKGTLR